MELINPANEEAVIVRDNFIRKWDNADFYGKELKQFDTIIGTQMAYLRY
ncbi:MAG TPA: hypothetical protein VL360_07335 [Gammaproteobacteria bacterium]|nr:hypothetical protein [Gammaproteobacteria bacterium]